MLDETFLERMFLLLSKHFINYTYQEWMQQFLKLRQLLVNPDESHVPIVKLGLQSSPPRFQDAHLRVELGFFRGRQKLTAAFQELLAL